MASSLNWDRRDLGYWQRWLAVWGFLLVCGLIVFLLTWKSFFVYVPPGKHLVIVAKNGQPLTEGEVLADEGQKGIQKKVMGEGWHFVLPVVYTTELEENTVIPPGKVCVVTARGGRPLPPGQLLADEGQKGIQRHVLPPGTYRLNLHGYDVEIVDAIEVKAGYVGV